MSAAVELLGPAWRRGAASGPAWRREAASGPASRQRAAAGGGVRRRGSDSSSAWGPGVEARGRLRPGVEARGRGRPGMEARVCLLPGMEATEALFLLFFSCFVLFSQEFVAGVAALPSAEAGVADRIISKSVFFLTSTCPSPQLPCLQSRVHEVPWLNHSQALPVQVVSNP